MIPLRCPTCGPMVLLMPKANPLDPVQVIYRFCPVCGERKLYHDPAALGEVSDKINAPAVVVNCGEPGEQPYSLHEDLPREAMSRMDSFEWSAVEVKGRKLYKVIPPVPGGVNVAHEFTPYKFAPVQEARDYKIERVSLEYRKEFVVSNPPTAEEVKAAVEYFASYMRTVWKGYGEAMLSVGAYLKSISEEPKPKADSFEVHAKEFIDRARMRIKSIGAPLLKPGQGFFKPAYEYAKATIRTALPDVSPHSDDLRRLICLENIPVASLSFYNQNGEEIQPANVPDNPVDVYVDWKEIKRLAAADYLDLRQRPADTVRKLCTVRTHTGSLSWERIDHTQIYMEGGGNRSPVLLSGKELDNYIKGQSGMLGLGNCRCTLLPGTLRPYTPQATVKALVTVNKTGIVPEASFPLPNLTTSGPQKPTGNDNWTWDSYKECWVIHEPKPVNEIVEKATIGAETQLTYHDALGAISRGRPPEVQRAVEAMDMTTLQWESSPTIAEVIETGEAIKALGSGDDEKAREADFFSRSSHES